MRAIGVSGDSKDLVIEEVSIPEPQPDEVRIKVVAAGVNRADLLQRAGFYPPPKGDSEIIGLEVSGRIDAVGADVDDWSVGDEVCALLAGGGYAEFVCVPAGQVLPVPEGVGLVEAAALPEVFSTVWSNVFMTANLQPGETVLFHGGSSGIGTAGIQLARQIGARIAVTAGSDDKLEACRALGADILINYRAQDFVEVIKQETDGVGANVILDVIGGKYLGRNLDALATAGRLVIIGMQGGTKAELNIAQLLTKRAAVIATSLRARPKSEKAAIVAAVREHVWPLIATGQIQPTIDSTYPLAEAAAAQARLDSGEHIGKVLLIVE